MTLKHVEIKGRKGVFLSMNDWRQLKKKLTSLNSKVSTIEKRRKEILLNFRKAKKEKYSFTSDIMKQRVSAG